MCDGSPLALRTIAERLEKRPHWTADRILQRLVDRQSGGWPGACQGDELGLRASVMASYKLLAEPARFAFRMLTETVHKVVSASLAAELLDVDEHVAEALLEDLVEFRLAEVDEVTLDGETEFYYWVKSVFRMAAVGLESAFDSQQVRESLNGSIAIPLQAYQGC